jgi:hypothetical protein
MHAPTDSRAAGCFQRNIIFPRAWPGGQHDTSLVHCRALHDRDLVLAEALPYPVQTRRKRGIPEGAFAVASHDRASFPGRQVRLAPWRAKSQWRRWSHCTDASAASISSKLIAPDLERLARSACPITSLASVPFAHRKYCITHIRTPPRSCGAGSFVSMQKER